MKKIEQNKKQKREAIIQAAQEIFRSNGFISSSMDRIADKANVTKQTVYRYFSSKEELFKAAIEAQRLASDNNFMDALKLENTEEALQSFAVGFIERHLSEEHLANVRLLVSEGPKVPEITRIFYAHGPTKMQTLLIQFIEDRFKVRNTEFEIDVFLNTLLSKRMPVLTGLLASPINTEIRQHAEKTIKMFMKLLDLKRG